MTSEVFGAPQANPLAGHFRIPGPHVHLPTGGAYLPKGAFEPDPQGSVPVYPMRAQDEYLLKNPDALMSGLAIQKLLESCVPAIKTPDYISSPDLDVLMLAIRVATYGDKMDLTARCPKCDHENEFECHLPSLLATVKDLPSEYPVRLNDELVAYVRPYNYANARAMSLLTFNETRRLQAVQNQEDLTDDDRQREMRVSMDRIANLEARLTADCVYKIVAPEAEVTNPQHIAEFMANTSSGAVKAIEKALAVLNDSGMDKSMAVTCQNPEECGHEWQTSVEFDPASFFD